MIAESLEKLSQVRPSDNPFPGLRPFELHESHLFFGREGQSERMLKKLEATRFLAVVGTSGSGKSSLVRAGLAPALLGGMMVSAGSNWRVAVLRPSNDPIGNLARALSLPEVFGSEVKENAEIQTQVAEVTLRRGNLGLVEAVRLALQTADENLLVVVDQFEELFRFAREAKSTRYENDAAAFVKLLLEPSRRYQSEQEALRRKLQAIKTELRQRKLSDEEARQTEAQARQEARERDVRIYVVLTMRSDFLGDCAQFWDLPEAVTESQYLIPRLTRDQLREAIASPVAVGDGQIAPRLVNQLLNDIGDDQDQLPVLQHALMRTWDERKRQAHDHRARPGEIDVCCYEAIGGMKQALSRHADEAYDALDARHQKIAERMFKALTERGEDNREIRRPATLGALAAVADASQEEVKTVIETFRQPGRSFLMPPAETPLATDSLIDISHESLIRGWERLSQWVEEEACSARVYTRLADTAELHRKGEAGLWRDPDLQIALDWREINKPNQPWARRYFADLSLAMGFLEQSRRVREIEAQRLAAEALEKDEQRKRELRQAKRLNITILIALLFVLILALIAFLQRNNALKNERKARRLVYGSNLVLAQNALMEGNYSKGNDILHDFLPGKGIFEDEDMREFYWYYLWRLYNNQKAKLKGHKHDITSVVFSPDGNTLASGSEDGTARLWDVRNGQALAVLAVEENSILSVSVAFSPDGATLATVGKQIKLWDVATRKEFASLEAKGTAGPIAFSPDGSKLASGGASKSLILWDLKSRQIVMTLQRHKEAVTAVAFSPGGTILASGSRDKTINLWEVKNGGHLIELNVGDDISSVAFSPDGKMLANGSWGNAIILWNVISGQKVATLEKGSGYVSSIAFSPDGKRLVSADWDDTVKIWDLSSKQELGSLRGHADNVTSVAFSPNGKTIASGGGDQTVRLWDANGVEEVKTLSGHIGPAHSVAFSYDGGMLASGGKDNLVRLWDWRAGKELAILKGHEDAVNTVAFSPDRNLLASGCKDGTIKIWRLGDRRETVTLNGHTDTVNAVAFSLDGAVLASGSGDKTIRLWDVKTGAQLAKLEGHKGAVNCIAFSPNGKTLVSGGGGDVGLWSLSSKQTVSVINTESGIITSMAFSRDGKMLAISNTAQTIKLLDIDSEKEILSLKGHTSYVLGVALSPDGKTLASASADKTVKLWDVQSGLELLTLKGHKGNVFSVAFSPSGKALASAGVDGKIRLWVAATDEEVEQQQNK